MSNIGPHPTFRVKKSLIFNVIFLNKSKLWFCEINSENILLRLWWPSQINEKLTQLCEKYSKIIYDQSSDSELWSLFLLLYFHYRFSISAWPFPGIFQELSEGQNSLSTGIWHLEMDNECEKHLLVRLRNGP